MNDLYPKVKKPIKGPKWLIIIFILVMIMWGIFTFFEPVWDRLMKIVTGG